MNLPDAPVAAFEIVLDSLYDGQFRLSPTFDDDLTLEVWKLTDYFDFKQLAKKILDEMERWCLEYKESREKEFSTSLPQQYAYGPGRPMENLILHVSALASPTLYPQLKRILQVFLFSTRRQDVDLSTGMTGLSTKRSVMKSTQTYCGRISVGRVSLSSKWRIRFDIASVVKEGWLRDKSQVVSQVRLRREQSYLAATSIYVILLEW